MNSKKLIPAIFAFVVFLLITLSFFHPVITGNKVIQQGDIHSFKGASKKIIEHREQFKEEPLWTTAMFCGMPAYQISTIYHGNLIKKISPALHLYLPGVAGYVFMYFVGFFILLLCLRLNPWVALIASIAYGLSSYFLIIIEAGHNSKADAIGYLAPLFGGIILIMNGRRWLGLGLTALFFSLELSANHVQITYYFFMMLFLYFLFEAIAAFRAKKFKGYVMGSLLVALGLGLGTLPNVTNLLATMEYGSLSQRGKTELTIKEDGNTNKNIVTSGLDRDYATQWSYGIGESFTFLIPNFKGGASSPISEVNKDALKKVDPNYLETVGGFGAYFGEQPFTSGPVYAGAIMVLLAVLGLFIVEGQFKWMLLSVTLLSFALSWGKNFMGFSNLFFDYLPGYNKFRTVSMTLVLAEFTIPLLAALALDKLVGKMSGTINFGLLKKTVPTPKVVLIAVGTVGGIALLCYLMPGMFTEFSGENELNEVVAQQLRGTSQYSEQDMRNMVAPVLQQAEIAREAIFKADALRSFGFVALAGLLIFMFVNGKVQKMVLLIGLGVLVTLDLFLVDKRYLNDKSFVSASMMENEFPISKADEVILNDKELDFRVLRLGNPFNDAQTSYYHRSIGGYHAAKLKRYQEVIDFYLQKEHGNLINGLRGGLTDSSLMALFNQIPVLSMLNTKYIIANPDYPPLENRLAKGPAWFVSDVVWANTADEEILNLGKINLNAQAIVNVKNKAALAATYEKDSTAVIQLKEMKENYLKYDAVAGKKQLAVFSEVYYPNGWNAYVDGQLVPHVNVNYVLRGLEIPSGKHVVEFKFEPKVYSTGETVALIGSLLVFALLALAIFMERKQKTVQATA